MSRVRHVIKNMVKPSWLTTGPMRFGHKGEGTLKAAEWRALYTVYLPIALVSVWGRGSTHANIQEGARYLQILDHTMSLVCAITLACKRTTSRMRAMKYRSHMGCYVRDLRNIHPHAKHTINMHVSLHIYNFLLLFGAVHSWWTFPFERLIGIMQRLTNLTNHKAGQSFKDTFNHACL